VPGLLPDAEILVADPFTRSGAGDERTDAFALVQALEHLVDAGVDAVNLSLAGPENDVLAETVDRALDRGVALVAAAGNQGPGGDPLYPAAYAGVVAVTAVDGRNRLYRRANRGGHIDFAAPGVDVPTAASVRGVRPQTGTSFATPFVTAALASRIRAEPGLEPPRAVEALSGETIDLGEAGHDPLYGWGLVQVRPGC
jgi:subtilisin family serine protease